MYEVMRGWVNRFLSDEEGVLLAALLIVSVLIIVTMGTVLAPLLTGIVLAYVMQGAIKAMERFQIPKGVAVSITFVIFMGFFLSLLFFVIPLVWRQLQSLFQNIPSMVERTRDLLGQLPLNYPELVSEQQVTSWIELLNGESAELGQWLLSFSLSQLPLLAAVAVYIMLVPLLVFFILKDQQQILAWCSSYLPSEKPLLDRIGREMDEQMANYIRGKVLEIIMVGGASFVFFQLMGLEYAALLGFLPGARGLGTYPHHGVRRCRRIEARRHLIDQQPIRGLQWRRKRTPSSDERNSKRSVDVSS